MSELNKTIRTLNDELRSSGSLSGTILITHGIQSLGPAEVAEICLKVSDFDAFDQDNDPHGEHDFGAFDHEGHRVFWKIDCYDTSMQFASPNPADSAVSKRVLTIMLAEEY